MDSIENHYKTMVELNDMIKCYENDNNYYVKKQYQEMIKDEIISKDMYNKLETRYY